MVGRLEKCALAWTIPLQSLALTMADLESVEASVCMTDGKGVANGKCASLPRFTGRISRMQACTGDAPKRELSCIPPFHCTAILSVEEQVE